jgi:hypothetical protein
MKIPSALTEKFLNRYRRGKDHSMMKKIHPAIALLVAAVGFGPLVASAQSTYTTLNGTVNLVAGLTNLTSATAINTTNQSLGIQYITDSSWSTAIGSLGVLKGRTADSPGSPIPGGTLAGSFGGGTYSAGSNGLIFIGFYPAGGLPVSGSWTVRLLLSDDTYSSPNNYADADLVLNPAVPMPPGFSMFGNEWGQVYTDSHPSAFLLDTLYLELDIAAFDTNNIGFKGIELSNLGDEFPDIGYIGVTAAASSGPDPSPVPEPGQVAASLLLLSGIGGYVWMKRRKAAKPATAAA